MLKYLMIIISYNEYVAFDSLIIISSLCQVYNLLTVTGIIPFSDFNKTFYAVFSEQSFQTDRKALTIN